MRPPTFSLTIVLLVGHFAIPEVLLEIPTTPIFSLTVAAKEKSRNVAKEPRNTAGEEHSRRDSNVGKPKSISCNSDTRILDPTGVTKRGGSANPHLGTESNAKKRAES